MDNYKQEQARAWVNGYAFAGASIVVAAVVPGSTSAALFTIECQMCYQIGKIYRGDDFSWGEAVAVAGIVGIAAVAGKFAALEALNLFPIVGWAAKAAIAAGIIKGLGEAIIAHYESTVPTIPIVSHLPHSEGAVPDGTYNSRRITISSSIVDGATRRLFVSCPEEQWYSEGSFIGSIYSGNFQHQNGWSGRHELAANTTGFVGLCIADGAEVPITWTKDA